MKRDSESKPTERRLLGMRSAGEYLDCSPWTVRKRIYSGAITGVKIGAKLCVEKAELDRFIERNRTQ